MKQLKYNIGPIEFRGKAKAVNTFDYACEKSKYPEINTSDIIHGSTFVHAIRDIKIIKRLKTLYIVRFLSASNAYVQLAFKEEDLIPTEWTSYFKISNDNFSII